MAYIGSCAMCKFVLKLCAINFIHNDKSNVMCLFFNG